MVRFRIPPDTRWSRSSRPMNRPAKWLRELGRCDRTCSDGIRSRSDRQLCGRNGNHCGRVGSRRTGMGLRGANGSAFGCPPKIICLLQRTTTHSLKSPACSCILNHVACFIVNASHASCERGETWRIRLRPRVCSTGAAQENQICHQELVQLMASTKKLLEEIKADRASAKLER